MGDSKIRVFYGTGSADELERFKNSATLQVNDLSAPTVSELNQIFGVKEIYTGDDIKILTAQLQEHLRLQSQNLFSIPSILLNCLKQSSDSGTGRVNTYKQVVFYLYKYFIDLVKSKATGNRLNQTANEKVRVYIESKIMNKQLGATLIILAETLNSEVCIKVPKVDIQNNFFGYKSVQAIQLIESRKAETKVEPRVMTKAETKAEWSIREYKIGSVVSEQSQNTTLSEYITDVKNKNSITTATILGVPAEDTGDFKAYIKLLVKLKQQSVVNQITIEEHGIQMPTTAEIQKIGRFSGKEHSAEEAILSLLGNTSTFEGYRLKRELVCKLIMNELHKSGYTSIEPTKLYNIAAPIIALYERYIVTKDISQIVVYGEPNKHITYFINIMNHLGIRILLIIPTRQAFDSPVGNVIKLDTVRENLEYPSKEVKDVAPRKSSSTIAYQASQEMNELLYNGQTLGLYRDRQFIDCKSLLVKSTLDDIRIYWNQEVKFRQHFKVENQVVTVPNFFVKISGVGDTKEYYKLLEELNKDPEHTLIYDRIDFLHDAELGIDLDKAQVNYESDSYTFQGNAFIPDMIDVTPIKSIRVRNGAIYSSREAGKRLTNNIIKNGLLDIEQLLKSNACPFSHLEVVTQVYILKKIQETLNSKDIILVANGLSDADYYDVVLSITLQIGKSILRLLQWFDFTKATPKLIVLSNNEREPTLLEAIYLLFLSYLGFDIAIIVPTMYRSIGAVLNSSIYQDIQIGEPKFDISSRQIAQAFNGKASGFLSKIMNTFGGLL